MWTRGPLRYALTLAAAQTLLVSAHAVMAQEASAREPVADAAVYPAQVSVVRVSEGYRFVDDHGMTLYMLDAPQARQRTGDAMTFCVAACAASFVPFTAAPDAVAVGFWKPAMGARGRQWTYRGSPVFASTLDNKAGDVAGDGWQDVVHTITWVPPTPRVVAPAPADPHYVRGEYYLADAAGRLMVTCDTACPDLPPFTAGSAAVGFGAWSVVVRSDGKQWAWRGQPVFLSASSEPPSAGSAMRPIIITRP